MTFDICNVHRFCNPQLGKGVSGTPKNANILRDHVCTPSLKLNMHMCGSTQCESQLVLRQIYVEVNLTSSASTLQLPQDEFINFCYHSRWKDECATAKHINPECTVSNLTCLLAKITNALKRSQVQNLPSLMVVKGIRVDDFRYLQRSSVLQPTAWKRRFRHSQEC